MRELPAGLAERLREPATTLASAWRLTRRDGAVLGFTDHDADLRFDGTLFHAASGWTAGEAEGTAGLVAGTAAVGGALSCDALSEEDIAAGGFDGARIEVFRVDWSEPALHVLVDVAELGPIRRAGGGFSAELRGLAARLDDVHGRTYRRRCDAVLGDRRCGVDLTAAAWRRDGTLVEGGEGRLVARLGPGIDAALFGLGRVVLGNETLFLAGLTETETPGDWRLALAEPEARVRAVPGAALRLLAGCDRSFATCRDRFRNALNFRGFPHMPGNDAALGVAKRDGAHDGSPVVP
ncbi:DUF2163 domain-containing protein [Aureimonas sp. AU4]|uniref:DUF2163 domain-containing protein n=1 Tax=Aureimonas sp. AU4 TaxID=1638163 RepID=UPI0007831242|nr:DUF2163 domain-containing protein [Aureimonas sp. AU4]